MFLWVPSGTWLLAVKLFSCFSDNGSVPVEQSCAEAFCWQSCFIWKNSSLAYWVLTSGTTPIDLNTTCSPQFFVRISNVVTQRWPSSSRKTVSVWMLLLVNCRLWFSRSKCRLFRSDQYCWQSLFLRVFKSRKVKRKVVFDIFAQIYTF